MKACIRIPTPSPAAAGRGCLALAVLCAGWSMAACGAAPGVPGRLRGEGGGPGVSWSDTLQVLGDTNRDGDVTDADLAGRARWTWHQEGAFCLANVDDDDGDGRPDATDEAVNGASDAADLAPVRVRLPAGATGSLLVEARASAPQAPPLRLFVRAGDGWRLVTGPLAITGPEVEFGLEAAGFATGAWDGRLEVRAEVRSPEGRRLQRDAAAYRVAPFLLLPNTARTRTLYVATGHPRYENLAFREGLAAAAAATGVRLVTHTTRHWKEMWMQDTMEVGYTQLPGRAPMHVVLGGLRGADSFGPRLAGRDVGFLQVGRPRGISDGVDDWADWMGNLEVTPPVPGHPFGRVFYGHNTDTGVRLHPELVAFLEAQQVQAPFWVDTSFLTIKHVDEIVNFVPGPGGRPRLLLADTRRAEALAPDTAGPSNTRAQARLDKLLRGGSYASGASTRGLLAELGLAEADVLRLPVSYEGGHNVWSNPVNSVWLNGTVLTGRHRLPAAVAADLEARFLAAGAEAVRFLDDAAYQDNMGNVHCATNTLRMPVVTDLARGLARPGEGR